MLPRSDGGPKAVEGNRGWVARVPRPVPLLRLPRSLPSALPQLACTQEKAVGAARFLAHLHENYWISARPLLVRRTSSPMTVMFSSRPTIRLVLPGIAPPAR